MTAVLKIRSFKGIADPGEDADEYLDDVQMAAEAWENGKGDATSMEKSLLRFFRQNLEPNYEASWWWGGLAKEEKTNWTTVKTLFLKKFADPVSTGTTVGYDDTNEILGLCQKAGQSIEEYLREAEHLHRKIKPVLRHTLAAAVVKGLSDEQKRSNVSFALSGTEFDFEQAVEKVKAAYRSIGEPDPFKPKPQKHWPSTNPFYSAPGGMGPPGNMAPPPIPVMAAIGHRRTTSYDGNTQQHPGGSFGRPSTSDGNQASGGKLSQAEFNAYMENYVKQQKAQDFRMPAQTPVVTNPALPSRGFAGNPWITCFNCGQKGHRSTECSGTPLPWEEQVKIRERVAMESQEYRNRRASYAGPASGSNAVALVTAAPAMQRRTSDGPGASGPVDHVRTLPVNNIQLVRMGNSQSTAAAFAMLHRVPGVLQAVKNAAMAVKRGQDEAGLDENAGGPAKAQRTGDVEVGPSATAEYANDAALPTGNDTALPSQPDAAPPPRTETAPPSQNDAQALRQLISEEVDRAIRRATEKDDTVIPVPPVLTKPRARAPIKLMRNEPKYDLEAVLRDIIPKISLPQLLDISPTLRQELKDLLQSTIPRLRKRKIPLAAFNTIVKGIPPAVTCLAEEDKDVSCLYISCFVGGFKVSLTLVDGGAQIELVSEAVVRQIGCKTYTCKDTAMRLANDSVVPLPCYAWLDINVSGVLARVKAYVMPIEMSFLILLSRRWLSRVQAVEDHSKNVIYIKGSDGVVHSVLGSPAPAVPSIAIASQQAIDAKEDLPKDTDPDMDTEMPFDDVDAAEQAIDILLDELDHWDEDQESGNGSRLR
jgi:hypothetical protein